MYKLNQVKLNIGHSEDDLRLKIAKTIKVSVDCINWSTLIILHKSIDARDKNNILFVYNIAFDFACKNEDVIKLNSNKRQIKYLKNELEKYEPIKFNHLVSNSDLHNNERICKVRPVVVGFGPAGIFASYIYALNGLRPIVIERGKSLEDREKDVNLFFKTLELNEDSNVCFGEGGAGAFSDGKLNTNNKDKTGVYHFVLETFVKFGADEKILYENLPHIGTDKLVFVIKNIRNEIIRLGGEIYYDTKLVFKDGKATLAPTNNKNALALNDSILIDAPIILAIGNSSRDTFRDLIDNGFDLKPKPFAIGYRIAHKQSLIDEAQFGKNTKLPPATYKLTYDVGNGHSVYSFCMCPGGYIINSANFKNMLSINGMSYNDRSGKYANSAIVETISPDDILSSKISFKKEALALIEFQEMIERKAFELEKGFIPYVSSNAFDICEEEVFKGKAKYCEKLKTVFDDLGLNFNINNDIEKALKHFNRIIPGFYKEIKFDEKQEAAQYIIAGVETRTSSPVKLDRDENYMCNVENFYPCGEGLGHGGGIMSCAVDGIRVAKKIIEMLYR